MDYPRFIEDNFFPKPQTLSMIFQPNLKSKKREGHTMVISQQFRS